MEDEDITKSIEKIISKELGGSKLAVELLQPGTKELIVKAIEANPRQLKRFINNIILAKSVFFSNEPDENIDIDKLVAVQALNFRPEWNRFLQLITPNPIRKLFFEYYYSPLKRVGKVINSEEALANLKKEKDNDKKSLPEMIIDIFQELVKQENDSLRSFLDDAGADKILEYIDEMEKYRRALEATKFKEGEKQLKEGERRWSGKAQSFNKLLLQLLSAGEVSTFNDMRSMDDEFSPNLSYADLSNADLSYAKLQLAILSYANLSYADLSYANLPRSIMIGTRYQPQGENFKCIDADLKDAIIDDENLVTVLKDGNAKNVPPAAENKKELRKRLEDIGLPINVVDNLLLLSSLRD